MADDALSRACCLSFPHRQPNAEILLCGHMDLHPERHFDGLVAQLSIYARPLHPGEIEAMYQDVLQHQPVNEGIGGGSGGKRGQEDGPADDELSGTESSHEKKLCRPLLPGPGGGKQGIDVTEGSSCDASEICIPINVMREAAAPVGADDTTKGESSSEAPAAAASGQCMEVPRGLEPLLRSYTNFDDNDGSSNPPSLGSSNSTFPVPTAWFALGGDKAFEAWPPAMPSLKQRGPSNDRYVPNASFIAQSKPSLYHCLLMHDAVKPRN